MGTSTSKITAESTTEARSSGWKTGSKTASIPGPFSTLNSFEKMAKSSDFKDWVCRNLDSDYLVSSILIDTPTSEGLVDNIEFFRTLSPSLNEEISHHINDFELATVAGVDLHLSDTLNVCENELSLRMSAVSSPFFRSFQMRLIALKGLEECVIGEKRLAQEERKIRDYFAADLNSSTYPQLVFVLGLMKCGVNYITVFPKCINLLADQDQESKTLLIMPIENLCSTICSLSNLQLFSCWSPLRRAPLKKISLRNASITASSGNFPGAAIDGKPATYWLCSRSRATWTIELDKSAINSPTGVAVNVVAIQISWRPKQLSAVPHNSAPKKMSIYVKKVKDKTESGNSEYSRILSVDPELEFGKQNSWTQTYFINCPDVSSIQISVSKQSASNPTNSIKMYSFEVLTEDSESSSVQTLALLKQVQSALMPLLEYDYFEKIVYDTVLSMVRASGSLSLAITFIHFIHTKHLDVRLKAIAGDSVFMLFESLSHEEHLLREEAESYSAAENSSVDALFDETAKSALVEVVQCGQVACLSANKPGHHHCMLAAIMDSGTWTWDFSMMAVKDVTSSFGVVRRPLEDGGEVISPDAWVVRCVDGEVRHGGKVVRPPIGIISPNDVCSFTYDADAETVTLSVNEGDPQLLFEHVPRGISPVVFLSEMGKSIKLLSVTHRKHGSSSRSESSSNPAHTQTHTHSTSNEITKAEDIQNRPATVTTLLLRKMARLSKAKMAHTVTQLIESKKKQSSLLDHPYCIEVSAETLHQLVLFLQNVTTTMVTARNLSYFSAVGAGCPDTASTFASTDNELQVLSLLQLIDSQLYCLSCSEVDQVSVGLLRGDTMPCATSETQGSTESMPTIQLLSSLLGMLRQSSTCTEDVRCAASKAFARGSSLFLPTAENKTELILSILKTALRAGALDNATVLLLEMLLQKQSRHFEVLQVIELYKRRPNTRPLVHDLLKCLLFILQKNALQIFPLQQAKCREIAIESHQCFFPVLGQSGFQRIITAFLGRFQEQIIYDLTVSQGIQASTGHLNRTADIQTMIELLQLYFILLAECSLVITGGANEHEILLRSVEMENGNAEKFDHNVISTGKLLPQSGVDRHLRDTPLCQLLMPFIHGLVCISTSRDLELVAGVLPVAMKLLEGFSRGVRTSPSCAVAMSAVNSSIRRVIPRPVAPSEVGGWEVVKAAFEDGELSYSVSESGTLYTSIHSSNTCGVVSVGFDRTQRAAWEFCLEADSVSDECSVFGAARMPVSSRCYSSSADLWMRRAYNGYMYAQGQPRGAAMEKIHPNDIVRIEFDGPEGTLSFSLNGSEPVIGFQDITETIHPACGSYRSAVKIRLLKVEVYGAGNVDPDDPPGVNSQCPLSPFWVLDKSLQHSLEPSVLTLAKNTDCALDGKSWLTARGNRGAAEGVHDWSFELLHRSHAPFALGVVVGGELCPHDVLGGPCVAPADARAAKGPSSRRAQGDASSSGVLSPPRASASLPPISPASSNWSEMRTSAPAERRGRFLLNRRRGRNRSDSGDDERERARDDSRSGMEAAPVRSPTRSTVSAAVAFQRLLRAAAPVFVPATPQRTVPENDLNVDLDEILATFLSSNNSDMTHIFQQTSLPTSFLSLDAIPFAQEIPIETDAVLDLRPPQSSDLAMAALFVDGVAQMEQSALEARVYERCTLSSIAAINASTVGPNSDSSASAAAHSDKSDVENGITTGEVKVDSSYGDRLDPTQERTNYEDGMLAMAWHSDGSLWVNGQKLAEGFGSNFLPLDRMSSISIRVNRTERTVTYFVNGVYVGIAFGPDGSDAAVQYALPAVVSTEGGGCASQGHTWGRNIVYPAGSISLPTAKDMPTSALHSIKLKSSGFNGSIVLPLQLTLQKSCASVVGRLSSILLAGPVLDAEEMSLMCWLKSPLLLGGMDDDLSLLSNDDIFLSTEAHANGSESNGGVEVDAGVVQISDGVRVKKIPGMVDGEGEETEKEVETVMREEGEKDLENGTRHMKSIQTDKAFPPPELQTVIGSLTRLEYSGVKPQEIGEEGKEKGEKKKGREKEQEQHRNSSAEVLPSLRHGELYGESEICAGRSKEGDLTYIFIPKEAQKDVSFINDVKYTVHYDFKAGIEVQICSKSCNKRKKIETVQKNKTFTFRASEKYSLINRSTYEDCILVLVIRPSHTTQANTMSWSDAWKSVVERPSITDYNEHEKTELFHIDKKIIYKPVKESNQGNPTENVELIGKHKKNGNSKLSSSSSSTHISNGEPNSIANTETYRSKTLLRNLSFSQGSRIVDENVPLLISWLESILPESPSLRTVLERSGSYSFPICELPFLACLLKHSGCIVEALDAIDALLLKRNAEQDVHKYTDEIEHEQGIDYLKKKLEGSVHPTSSLESSTHGCSSTLTTDNISMPLSAPSPAPSPLPQLVPVPSDSMISVWRRVKQLRTFLRQQRQRSRALATPSNTAPAPVPASSNSSPSPSLSHSLAALSGTLPVVTSSVLPPSTPSLFLVPPASSSSSSPASSIPSDIIPSQRLDAIPASTLSIADIPSRIHRIRLNAAESFTDSIFTENGGTETGDENSSDGGKEDDDTDAGREEKAVFLHSLLEEFIDTENNSDDDSKPCAITEGLIEPDDVEVFQVVPELNEVSAILTNNSGQMTGTERKSRGKSEKQHSNGGDLTSEIPDKFNELCILIRSKALFLLRVNPARIGSETDYQGLQSKIQLTDLMKQYSKQNGVQDDEDDDEVDVGTGGGEGEERDMIKNWFPPLLRNQSSLTGQERWRKVIEFLRVHSKAKKDVSTGSEGGSSLGDALGDSFYHSPHGFADNSSEFNKDLRERRHQKKSGVGAGLGVGGDGSGCSDRDRDRDRDRNDEVEVEESTSGVGDDGSLTPLQAVLQSCAVFCTAEGICVSPQRLDVIMKRRSHRAALRVYALQALGTVMSMESVVGDPFCMEELLLYARSAITSSAVGKRGSPTSHYLANLEGCNASTLGEVQRSFQRLFASLANILSQYIESWEHSSRSVLSHYFLSEVVTSVPASAESIDISKYQISQFMSSPPSVTPNTTSASSGNTAGSTTSSTGCQSPDKAMTSLIGESMTSCNTLSPLPSLPSTPIRNSHKQKERSNCTRVSSHKNIDKAPPAVTFALHPLITTLTPESAHVLLGPIKMMLALWALHFSSRDNKFLMQAGFLPCVYKLISLVSTERASNAHTLSTALLLAFKKAHTNQCHRTIEKWTLWSASDVKKGLLDGTLSCRSVISHLIQAPDNVLTRKEKALLGLDADFLVLCSRLSLPEVSLLLIKAGEIICNKEEEEKKKLDTKASEDAAINAQVEEEMARKLSACGTFNVTKAASDLTLDHRNTHAMRRMVESVTDSAVPVCAFCTVEYDITNGPGTTGNYFEVTILLLGEKDIGVGLAEPSFPFTQHMPGWIDGSYGYHGDDGRKFGRNATMGYWPLFEAGDVIGCGINMTRRAIFHTRNGTLLGDSFTDVRESHLIPIVGFSNRHGGTEQIEINFGAKPFRYTGSEVHILAAATSFRCSGEISEQEAELRLAYKNLRLPSTLESECSTTDGTINEEEKEEKVFLEEKEGEPDDNDKIAHRKYREAKATEETVQELSTILSDEEYSSAVAVLSRHVDLSLAHIAELTALQSYASSLLHFLFAVICKGEDDLSDSGSENFDEIPGEKAPSVNATTQDTGDLPVRTRPPTQFFAPALVKSISIFGTPRFVTSADSCELQQGLTVSIIQELLIGARALSSSNFNFMSDACVSGNENGSGMCGEFTGGQLLKDIRVEKKHLQCSPSYRDSSSLASIQRDQGIFKSSDESARIKPILFVRPFSSVEAIVVESFLYAHLLALDALLPVSAILKKELCGVHATAALFSLLKRCSTRLHKLICNILIKTLPDTSPEDVEVALQGLGNMEGFGGGKSEASSLISSHFTSSSVPFSPLLPALNTTIRSDPADFPVLPHRRRQRRMPDTAVHLLMSTVRDALAVTTTTPATNLTNGTRPRHTVKKLYDDARVANIQSFGNGRARLESADRHICIVQRLFEAPAWRELVACNITDCLRSAGKVLKNVMGEGPCSSEGSNTGCDGAENGHDKINGSKCCEKGIITAFRALSSDEENIIMKSCAACASLSGLGLLRVGGKVLLKDGSPAHLVDVCESKRTARVYRVSPAGAGAQCSGDLKCLQAIETTKLGELSPKWVTADVDLSRLSQPLLLHLVCLVQLLLQWFSTHHNGADASAEAIEYTKSSQTADLGSFDSLMYRLCALAVTALSVLMTRYPDTIIEAAQDVHTVRDIISISSRPTGLPFFPTLARVNKMWGFAQARVLEMGQLQRDNVDTRKVSKKQEDLKANGVSVASMEGIPAADIAAQEPPLTSTSTASTLISSILPTLSDPFPAPTPALTSVLVSAPLPVAHSMESLLFDASSRAARTSIADTLSSELKAPRKTCLHILEYFMGDVERARNYFSNYKGDFTGDDIIAEQSEIQLELSDENPLRNLGVCYPFGDAKKENVTSPWRSLIPSDITLDRLVAVNAPAAPLRKASLSFVESVTGIQLSEKSAAAVLPLAPDKESKEAERAADVECNELALGTCLVRCDEEGPTQFPCQESMRVCMSEGAVRSHIIVSSFNFDLGIGICEAVETSTLRGVKKFFEMPVNTMPSFIQRLDVSVTILRLREIASKLLEGGNLHLHKDVEKVDDWMRVLRLAVFTESKASADFTDRTDGDNSDKPLHCLSAMCGAILLRARNSLPLPLPPSVSHDSAAADTSMVKDIETDMVKEKETEKEKDAVGLKELAGPCSDNLTESLEGKMVDLLIAEVEESFRTLSLSTLRTDSTNIKEEDVVVCASSHPFSTPFTSSGRIDIPPKWRGAQVNFHASCSTPSKLASLNFFKSKTEYDADTPCHSFFGKPSDDTSTFRSFVLTDATCLYYRFDAISGSDRSMIGVKSDDGNIFTDPADDSISIAEVNSLADIGLGEDDSLFNLFNEPEPDDPEGKAKCVTATSTHGVKAGLWFYEVTVVKCDEAEGLEQLAMKNVIGITSTFANAPVGTEDSVNCAECSVCFTIAGAVFVRKKLNREVFEGRPVDTGLGGWTEGDVLGCLFEVITRTDAMAKAKTPLPSTVLESLSQCRVTSSNSSAADAVQINVWFHRNGKWSKCTKVSSLAGQSVECCRSVFSIRGKTKLLPNFGKSDFAHPPLGKSIEHIPDGIHAEVVEKGSEIVCNSATNIGGGKGTRVDSSGQGGEGDGVIVATDPDDASYVLMEEGAEVQEGRNGDRVEGHPSEQGIHASSSAGALSTDSLAFVSKNQSGILPGFQYPWLPMLARAVEEEDHPNAWGYHFEVRPLLNLKLRVSRDFTLVWSLKTEESEAASATRSKELFIWRPKKPSNYVTLGDMVTLSNHPPIGAVVAEKKLCVPPISFIKVIGIKPLDLMIWRPIAPKGFVALGDIATKFLSTPQPLHEFCYCVPVWATTDCDIGKNAFSSKKGSSDSKTYTFSLWHSRNLLGTFFGSPYEVVRMTTGVSRPNVCDGVPKKTFGLKYDTLNALSGEWVHEEDVRSSKSLLWATSMLHYLLDNQSTRKRALTAPLFSSAVDYIRSAGASGPLQAVPLLIRLVRLAYAENVELCMDSIKELCNSILLKALGMVKVSASAPLSEALVSLVDLVVEVQTIEIATVALRQGRGIRSTSSSDCFLDISQTAIPDRSTECDEAMVEKHDIGEAVRDPGPSILPEPLKLMKPIGKEVVVEDEEEEDIVIGACYDDWWDRSCVSKEEVSEAQIIKDENLDALFSNEHISRKLRQIINFLHALVARPSPENTAAHSPLTHPSYPRMLIAQVWQRHVSTCFVEESHHPYTERRMKKKIFFPGADKLTVTFDRRSCVGHGAKIFLRSKGTILELSGSFGEDVELHGGVVFGGSELVIEFRECVLNILSEKRSGDAKVSNIEIDNERGGYTKNSRLITSVEEVTLPNVIERREVIGSGLSDNASDGAVSSANKEKPSHVQEQAMLEESKAPSESSADYEVGGVNPLGDWGWGLVIQASGLLYKLRSVSATVPHSAHTNGGEAVNAASQKAPGADTSDGDIESESISAPLSSRSALVSVVDCSSALNECILRTSAAPVTNTVEPPIPSPTSQHFSLDPVALEALVPGDGIDSDTVPSDDIPASTPTDSSGDPDSPNACRNAVRGGTNNNREEDGQFSIFRPRTRRGRERGEIWSWRREMRSAGADSRAEADRSPSSTRMDRSVHRVGADTATIATTTATASASAVATALSATSPVVDIPAHSEESTSIGLSAGVTNPCNAFFSPSASSSSASSERQTDLSCSTFSLPSTLPPLITPSNSTPVGSSPIILADLNGAETNGVEDTLHPPSITTRGVTDELSSIEKYVNNNDRMLFAAATYGLLIAEGEITIPHSLEMNVTVSRTNPLGDIYPYGMNLIKSLDGACVELNMACAIIYVITFSYTCRSVDDDEMVEVVHRLQSGRVTDCSTIAKHMSCTVKASSCHYRITSISAADAYVCLVNQFTSLNGVTYLKNDQERSSSGDFLGDTKALQNPLRSTLTDITESLKEASVGVSDSDTERLGSAPAPTVLPRPVPPPIPALLPLPVLLSTPMLPPGDLGASVITPPEQCDVDVVENLLEGVSAELSQTSTSADVTLSHSSLAPGRGAVRESSDLSTETVLTVSDGREGKGLPALSAPTTSDDSGRDQGGKRCGDAELAECSLEETFPEAGPEISTAILHGVAHSNHVPSPGPGPGPKGGSLSHPTLPFSSTFSSSSAPITHVVSLSYDESRYHSNCIPRTVLGGFGRPVLPADAHDDSLCQPDGDTPIVVETQTHAGKGTELEVEVGTSKKGDLPLLMENNDDDAIAIEAKGKFFIPGTYRTRVESCLVSKKRNPKQSSSGCGMLLPSELQSRLGKWSMESDYALLEYINLHGRDDTSAVFSQPGLVALPKQFLSFRGSSMSEMHLIDIQARILLFESLNKHFEDLLPIMNILNDDPLSLGAMIRKCNRYIFMSVKQPLLDRVIAATVITSGYEMPVQLALDNVQSMSSREKNGGSGSDVNCFVQAFRQLKKRESSVYRHVFSTDRVFQISFVGESGIDAGGVFREGVSRIVEDLFSEHFNLLLLSPNGKYEVHSNMEKYIPNPSFVDPLSIQMFEFIGRLMGMSLRVKLCLPFEFPSLVWKKLAGEEATFEDLLGVDAISCRLLMEIKNCDNDGIHDDISFNIKYGGKLKFVHIRSDGIEEELETGSKDRVVRYSNRLQYCDMVEKAKLTEFDQQINAIERGMAEVTPMRYLKLFSWQQLETLVAGSPLFDFNLWKLKTEASGLSAKTVDLFWKVMASLTAKEQSGFIRFAWGRSRLPPPKDFNTKMKLNFGQGRLPVAHTCFFSIELPEYATEEEMRTGLLTAINFGVGGILMG